MIGGTATSVKCPVDYHRASHPASIASTRWLPFPWFAAFQVAVLQVDGGSKTGVCKGGASISARRYCSVSCVSAFQAPTMAIFDTVFSGEATSADNAADLLDIRTARSVFEALAAKCRASLSDIAALWNHAGPRTDAALTVDEFASTEKSSSIGGTE